MFGVTVYLDLNENGQRDASEPSRVTGQGGNYIFSDLTAGQTYVVAEEVPAGYAQTFPGLAASQVHRLSPVAGQAAVAHFGNTSEATIHGAVFRDTNDDGLPSGFEPRLAGRIIFVDGNQNSRRDPREPFSVTDTRGEYLIRGVPPGVHTVVDPFDVATLTDPSGGFGRDFGFSLAVSGASIVVGDPSALVIEPSFGRLAERGRVHVFNRGNLQFVRELVDPNPSGDPVPPASIPSVIDGFGFAVAAAGNSVAVGKPFRLGSIVFPNVGEVLLFDLLENNVSIAPRVGDLGVSLAWIGPNLFVGNPDSSERPEPSSGEVHGLMGPVGPAIADSDFGEALGTLGHQFLLVGDPAFDAVAVTSGAAYLFDPSREDPAVPNQMLLLQTFLHPTNQIGASFGTALASTGTRVIVGAPGDPVGGQDSGAVYLFDSITGNLMQPVFNNPTPAANDRFGFSIAVVGDKVLIGAPGDDTQGTNAGAAYLFDIATGELLQRFFSPTPLVRAQFGFSLAAVDEDRVIIGAPSQNVPQDSGAAYVFSIPSRVTVTASGETATLHFPKVVDDDADGVPNNIEDRPGGIVDSNGDGLADRQQSNVATLRAADGNYVTLVAPELKSFVDVRVSSTVPAAAPPGTTFPMGLFDFTLDGVAASTSVAINVTFHSDQNFNDYYAFWPNARQRSATLVRFRVRYGHDDRRPCADDRGTSDDHAHRWRARRF